MIKQAFNLLITLLLLTNIAYASAKSEAKILSDSWAQLKYNTSGDAKKEKFEALVGQAEGIARQYPNNAEILTWTAAINSTYASLKGGLGALHYVDSARHFAERAIKVDDRVLNGYPYTILAALYHNVPGWPVSFGSDKKARQMFVKAAEIDSNDINYNFYYGKFLVDEKDYLKAVKHLQKAKDAPVRKGFEVADKGRKAEAAELLNYVRSL